MDEMQIPALWRLPDEELTTVLLACEQRLRREYGEMLRIVGEAETRGLGQSLGYRNTVGLLTDALRVSTYEAKTRVELAGATVPAPTVGGVMQPAPLAATGEALCTGEVNQEHVTAIEKAFRRCPDSIGPEQRTEGEQTLLDLARQAAPEAVRKAGRHLVSHWEDEGTPPEDREREQAAPRREFNFSLDSHGGMRFTGRLDPEASAQLEGLFGPLAKPDPTDANGNADTRSKWQRYGDALAEIIDLAARADDLSTQGGERAVLYLTANLEDLERRVRQQLLDIPGDSSLDAILRLGCAARVVPAVFGRDREILHMGRSVRYATTVQRHNLVLRDRGCAFPGCTRKPKYCTPHHVVWWVFGGHTDIDNMCLLCARHHRLIHHSDWQVRMVNGMPEFIPPAYLDPLRRPLRNTAHTIEPPGQQLSA